MSHHAQLDLLILGGTTEAQAIARAVRSRPDIVAPERAMISLAGRTSQPAAQALACRSGGFGGVSGLVAFLRDHRVRVLVDATHPFAARISANAVIAAGVAGVPLLSLVRPLWQAVAGDRWRVAADMAQAARLLGDEPRRVFLSVGRLELAAFAAAPQHTYVARLIDPPEGKASDLPPHLVLLRARGPFDVTAERSLLDAHRIDVVVSKHAGGAATYAKIAAARDLGLPVILVARPPKPIGQPFEAIDALVEAIAHHLAAARPAAAHLSASPRGV